MPKFNTVHTQKYSSVDELFESVYKNLVTRNHKYGFRGHSNSEWKLEPTVSRYVDSIKRGYGSDKINRNSINQATINKLHSNFKNNLIANNDLPHDKIDNIDLWQYGQHFGLPTPLLDWSYSPYVSLFFALEETHSEDRCLWILNLELIEYINSKVVDEVRPKFKDRISPESALNEQFPTLNIISDVSEFNRRKTFQQGFFTKHEYYYSLESWLNRITKELHFDITDKHVLEKHIFKCDEHQRIKALDALDRMNINHRTLFPDVFGSVQGAIASTYRSFSDPMVKHFNFSSSKF